MTALGVGIIGLQAGGGWASAAHVPALRSLSDDFEIVGVADHCWGNARGAAEALDIPVAFDSARSLITREAVDLVVVTAKVPYHLEIVTAAIEAGKHVYCEWPLGNGLAEARRLADLAEEEGIVAVAGTQARMAPEVRHAAKLVRQDFVGEVLSSSVVATGTWFGQTIDGASAYTLDDRNGATMLTVGVGHCLAAIEEVLAPIVKLSAVLATRRPTATNQLSGALIQRHSADHVIIAATLADGTPLSIHYRGGAPRGAGLAWAINGTKGDLLIEGGGGHPQSVSLRLSGGIGEAMTMTPLGVSSEVAPDADYGPMIGNVRRMYQALARDASYGTRDAPSFADAVRVHRILETIQCAAARGTELSCVP